MSFTKLSFFQWIFCSLIYFCARRNPKNADLNALHYFSILRALNIIIVYVFACLVFADNAYIEAIIAIVPIVIFWIVDIFLYQNKVNILLSRYNKYSEEKRKKWRVITIVYIVISIVPLPILALIYGRWH